MLVIVVTESAAAALHLVRQAAAHVVSVHATAVAMLADATQDLAAVLHHAARGKRFPERSWFLQQSVKLEQ